MLPSTTHGIDFNNLSDGRDRRYETEKETAAKDCSRSGRDRIAVPRCGAATAPAGLEYGEARDAERAHWTDHRLLILRFRCGYLVPCLQHRLDQESIAMV